MGGAQVRWHWRGEQRKQERQRETEKLTPDVTTVLRPPRVNLGLTYPSHTHHTHKHTQSSNVLQISGDNTFIRICIYLHFLSVDTHRNTHNLARHSVGMDTRSSTQMWTHTHTHTQIVKPAVSWLSRWGLTATRTHTHMLCVRLPRETHTYKQTRNTHTNTHA